MSAAPYPVDVLTLFPDVVTAYAGASILGKAQERSLLRVTTTDIRDFAVGKHRITDSAPYGGGAGMVMKVEPLHGAIQAARARLPGAKVLVMSPRGRRFDQSVASELVQHREGLVLVCGRYEGIDERVLSYVDGELSLGDFVLTGGELAAMVVVDAVARLVPGVLGNVGSSHSESFEGGLLEYPQYTRPPVFEGLEVPEILQCGDHARIHRWRRWKALQITKERRPDLLASQTLSEADRRLLALPEEKL